MQLVVLLDKDQEVDNNTQEPPEKIQKLVPCENSVENEKISSPIPAIIENEEISFPISAIIEEEEQSERQRIRLLELSSHFKIINKPEPQVKKHFRLIFNF